MLILSTLFGAASSGVLRFLFVLYVSRRPIDGSTPSALVLGVEFQVAPFFTSSHGASRFKKQQLIENLLRRGPT